MGESGTRQVNIEGLLATYKILGLETIDPETVVATFHVEPTKAVEWFDAAECEGLISHVHGSMYELTDDGKSMLDDVFLRGGTLAISLSSG